MGLSGGVAIPPIPMPIKLEEDKIDVDEISLDFIAL